jgi:hypothetical protein
MQRFTTIHFMLTETCSQNIETCSQKPVVGTSSCTSSCQLYSYRAYTVYTSLPSFEPMDLILNTDIDIYANVMGKKIVILCKGKNETLNIVILLELFTLSGKKLKTRKFQVVHVK